MPTDRTTATNTGRPLKPTLATTRTAKTPITPRLAPSVPSFAPAGSSQTGRALRSAATTPRAPVASQDDRTPVKAFLSSNVTPRSSSRKSRVGVSSGGSTPNGTPSATPISTWSSSTAEPPPKELGAGYRATSPKFFHAHQARAPDAQHAQLPPKKAPSFFYANGQQDERPRALGGPSPPLSAVGRSQPDSKFFHADSLLEPRAIAPILTPPPVSAQTEPWPGGPSKDNIHLSYRKGTSQAMRANLHSQPSALSIISGHSSVHDSTPQRSTSKSSAASASVRLGHGKSASLSSIGSITPQKSTPSRDMPFITPSPLHREKRVLSNGSLSESVKSAPLLATNDLSASFSSDVQSPSMTTGAKSALDHMNELAEDARRERKVLDLEISNSSLLAINRQLEKEVRKQKAELRRFHRLSRAGRFSTDTLASSYHEGFSAVTASDFGNLSDMSEEKPESEEPEYSSDSSFDESIMSPTVIAERDAAHRLRDEKRLQLDLSKHRDLLVDSQKMNQSLKRCMNWTEELIKEGQKALAYQVRSGDVNLGGRVLDIEENPEDIQAKALLSPWSPSHRETDYLERSFSGSEHQEQTSFSGSENRERSSLGGSDILECASLSGSERADRDFEVDMDELTPGVPELQDEKAPLGSPLGGRSMQIFLGPEGMEETY